MGFGAWSCFAMTIIAFIFGISIGALIFCRERPKPQPIEQPDTEDKESDMILVMDPVLGVIIKPEDE